MDVCKCIVPSRHGSTLNSRRAASSLVRLMEKEEKWEASLTTPKVLSLKIREESSQIVVSSAMRSKLWLITVVYVALCRDEFRGP
ncbi:hypothetical protein TNCV_4566201 [Trichonephila clavipes]|nr:hypothetical protein TNCV_4566201 [Trichonephila clavipes]